MPNNRNEPETATAPVPGGSHIRKPLSLIAGIAIARCAGANLRLDRSGGIPHGHWMPPELENSKIAKAVWNATMEATALTLRRAEKRARDHYEASVKRRTGAIECEWIRFIDILARQAVEGLIPAAQRVGNEIRCHGRAASIWTALAAHPLSEVRETAGDLRRLPDGGPDGNTERPDIPADFDESAAVKERYAGTIKIVEKLPQKARDRPGPGHAAVDLVLYDPDADLLTAAGAAYETAGAPYQAVMKGLRTSPDGSRSVATAVAETAEGRRWAVQPPEQPLGLARIIVEITASLHTWRRLASMAAKAGATVLLQPAGGCSGAAPPPESIRGGPLEREWDARIRAHEHLHTQLRAEGAPREAAQYALTAGHFTRGVIACGTDRAIRIIDWMLTQRGRAPQASELRLLGQELYRHLSERGAPLGSAGVFRGVR